MLRFVISLVVTACLATPALPASVWAGSEVAPEQIKAAKELIAAIPDAGTNPTNATLAQVLAAISWDFTTDPPSPPSVPAVEWEQTNIPADVCTTSKCEAIGKLICETKPGLGLKGSNIVFDYCITFCTQIPVRENPPMFWVAIECP